MTAFYPIFAEKTIKENMQKQTWLTRIQANLQIPRSSGHQSTATQPRYVLKQPSSHPSH